MLRRCTTVTIVLLLVCMAVAYGCQKSPEDARKELGALGVPYTHEAFVQAAQNNDKLAMELFLAAGMNPNRHHFGDQPNGHRETPTGHGRGI